MLAVLGIAWVTEPSGIESDLRADEASDDTSVGSPYDARKTALEQSLQASFDEQLRTEESRFLEQHAEAGTDLGEQTVSRPKCHDGLIPTDSWDGRFPEVWACEVDVATASPGYPDDATNRFFVTVDLLEAAPCWSAEGHVLGGSEGDSTSRELRGCL